MRRMFSVAFAFTVVGIALGQVRADDYTVDPAHSSISFQIAHMGLTWVHGRFNEFTGSFTIDKADPAKSTFELTIKTASVDTNNGKRDGHLRGSDFFDVKQYPVMTFKSTVVKEVGSGYQVTGNLTMHGKSQPVSFTLEGGKTAEFPKGQVRIGYHTNFTLKRSDFEMNKMVGPLGDEVKVSIGIEGVKK